MHKIFRKYLVLLILVIAYNNNIKAQDLWQPFEHIDGADTISFFDLKFLNADEGWLVGHKNTDSKNYGVIYHTTDRGLNWTAQNVTVEKKLTSIDFKSENHIVVVGDSGTVLISNDKGATWLDKTISPNILDDFRSVYMLDSITGVATGFNGVIYKTNDGWDSDKIRLQSGTVDKLESVYFSTNNIGWIVGSKYALKSTDAGDTWQPIQINGNTIKFKTVFFINEQIGFVGGSDNSGNFIILKTINGGGTWSEVYLGGNGKIRSIYFINESLGYAVGEYGLILKTTDGGNNWTQENSNATNELNNVYFYDQYLGWVSGNDGISLKYYDVPVLDTSDLPKNFSASASGDSLVKLTWQDNSDHEDGFRIDRDVDGNGVFNPLDTLAPNTKEYLDYDVNPETKYCYRIVIFNSKTTTSNWNDTSCVITGASNALPEKATGLYLQAGQDTSIILNWKDNSNNETGFQIERFSEITGGWSLYDTTAVDDTTYKDINVSLGVQYCYKVNTLGVTPGQVVLNDTSQCIILVKEPVLTAPSDGEQNQSLTLTMDWEQSAGATNYGLQVSTSMDFNTTIVNENNLSVTNYEVPSGLLNYDSTYYWRAKASNSQSESNWSLPWSFKTESEPLTIPEPPILVSPSNDTTNQLLTLTLDWEPSIGAQTYGLQVSATSNFSNLILDTNNISNTMLNITNGLLSYSTKYYWRVNAANDSGSSSWSNYFSFTTESAPVGAPDVPQLNSPANGSGNQLLTLQLKWDPSSGADTYSLQVSSNSDFSNLDIDTSNLSTTLFDVPSNTLQYGTNYYWRVKAKNNTGESNWSNHFTFQTENEPQTKPEAPNLISPNSNSSGLVLTIKLDWGPSSGATSYQVQVSTDFNFTTASMVLDEQNLTTTEYDISDGVLQTNTDYYWRVRGANSFGDGIWSNIWVFTTEEGIQYPPRITVAKTYTFSNTTDQSNYKLIGLPGDRNISIASKITGEHGTDWKAFYDNGANENYYVPFDGSSFFNFKPGNGFWIISKNTIPIFDQNVDNVTLNSDNTFSIETPNSTWNIISNPFNNPVLWSDVQQLNSLPSNSEIRSFENGNYNTTTNTEFKPYQAYYFMNLTGIDSLKIPYSEGKSLPKISLIENENNSVSLELFHKGLLKAAIKVGVDEESKSGLDGKDIFTPPGDFTNYNLVVYNDKIENDYKFLSTDIRNIIDAGQKYELRIKSVPGEKIDLKFIDSPNLSDYEIYLVDYLSNVYNLREQNNLEFSFTKQYDRMHLYIGKQNYIDEQLKDDLKAEFALHQNYPNPFNPTTNIRFGIAKESNVNIIVYNTLGEVVTKLLSDTKQTGNYEFTWNASNLTSGIYFLRMEATELNSGKNYQNVKKLILLK